MTTTDRWEAELNAQILADHGIPTRLIDYGVATYLGAASPTAIQLLMGAVWAARLWLSSPMTDAPD